MKKLIAILSLNVGVLPCFGDGCFFPRFGFIWLSSASFLSPIFTQIWVRNGVYQTYGFLGGPQFWETPKFRYGIQLWGMVLQREPLRELGMTMLSLCATTIREFFLMTEDNPHHPADFVTNHVTGWPFLESNVSFPEVSLDKTWFVDELFEGVASRSCLMLNISILFRQAFSSRTKWTMLPGLGGGMTLFTASRCSQWTPAVLMIRTPKFCQQERHLLGAVFRGQWQKASTAFHSLHQRWIIKFQCDLSFLAPEIW